MLGCEVLYGDYAVILSINPSKYIHMLSARVDEVTFLHTNLSTGIALPKYKASTDASEL